ncbi:unnamed protein product [Paramecium sonneborni]|uniref:Uncharacterized protein n=1 Tax=Paramecium sonneborni TaxID=65129 RepID=A0A8S1RIB0_9CILI|nr:unnamed protein product [Paramecium sonneborni]
MNPDYSRIKFTFPSLEKFIIMDFNKKIALEDLKFTFTNVLKIDLFGQKVHFSVSKGLNFLQLNSQQSLYGQQIQDLFKTDKNYIEIVVKFLQEGA